MEECSFDLKVTPGNAAKMCLHVEASFQKANEVIVLLLHDAKQRIWYGMHNYTIEQVEWSHDLTGDG